MTSSMMECNYNCDIEESIPTVTIRLPSSSNRSNGGTNCGNNSSNSPQILVQSASQLELGSKHSPPTTIRLLETNLDSRTINRFISISSNALNHTNNNNNNSSNHFNLDQNSASLNSTHRYSQSEINLSSQTAKFATFQMKQKNSNEELDYEKLNRKLIDTLGFNQHNHQPQPVINHYQNLPNKVNHQIVPCSSSVVTTPQSSNSTTEPAPKSFWGRLISRFCGISPQTRATYSHRFNRILYYLRVFLTHLFSTTGLCFLVVAYSCLGAVIFRRLESGHEMAVKQSLKVERMNTARELWNYTNRLNVLFEDRWMKSALDQIAKFEERVVDSMLKEGYGANVEKWSFSGALLYSVTVITTIGYGNVTCKTDWGRIATILYAIIGIPITFLCLANLGNLMAKAFRFSYRKICCCECFCPSKASLIRKQKRRASQRSLSRRRKQRHNRRPSSDGQIVQPTATFLLPPPPLTPPTGSSVATTTFFDNGSPSTLNGNGSLAPPSPALGRHNSFIVVQPNDVNQYLNSGSPIDLRRCHSLYNRSGAQAPVPPESPGLALVTMQSVQHDQSLVKSELIEHFNGPESDIESELDQDDLDALEDEERVPISLVFLLVLGYIILGAFMFSIWEQWGPIEGAYFCFTTLTTIGFGDLVPGSARLSEDHQDGHTKFIICCAYMMVGLALIAMSFNLVQEEIVIKCRRIARRLGIMPTSVETKKFAADNRAKFKALWGDKANSNSKTANI